MEINETYKTIEFLDEKSYRSAVQQAKTQSNLHYLAIDDLTLSESTIFPDLSKMITWHKKNRPKTNKQ